MWWGRSEPPVQAWVGAGRVAWLAPAAEAEVQLVDGEAEAIATVVRWRSRLPRGARLAVWLGGDLCRLSCVPAIAGVADSSEAGAAVAACLEERGLAEVGWSAVLAESAPAARLWRVACARTAVVDALRSGLGSSVRSIRPWWSSALRTLREGAHAGEALAQPGGQTLYAFDGASLTTCSWGADGLVTAAETIGPIDSLPAARRLVLRRKSAGRPDSARCAWLDFAGAANSRTGAPKRSESARPVDVGEAAAGLAPWVRWGDEF